MQRNRVVAPERGEAQPLLGRIRGALERHLEIARAIAHLRDLLDIVARSRRIDFILIGGRESLTELVQQCERPVLGQLCQQRLAQPIRPRSHCALEVCLQRGYVRLFVLTGHGLHLHGQPRERRFRDRDLALDLGAPEARQQHALDRAVRAGVVLLARNVDQARKEAPEHVTSAEQPQAVSFLEAERSLADCAQVVDRALDQIVAGQRVQDVLQRFAPMTLRIEAGLLHQPAHLEPQEGDVARALVVRDGCKQPEEPTFRAYMSVRAEHFDADVVEGCRAVHGGAPVGFGNDERILRVRFVARCTHEPHCVAVRGIVAQNAEAGAGARLELVEVLAVDELVLPVAEQREVVAGEPFEEQAGLREHLRGGEALGVAQLVRGHAQLHEHRLPVFDCGTNVAQCALQSGFDACEQFSAGLAHDLEVNERFGLAAARGGRRARRVHCNELALGAALNSQQRMDRDVRCVADRAQVHGERIDEKRHVIVGRLHDRVLGSPTVALERGIEHA